MFKVFKNLNSYNNPNFIKPFQSRIDLNLVLNRAYGENEKNKSCYYSEVDGKNGNNYIDFVTI